MLQHKDQMVKDLIQVRELLATERRQRKKLQIRLGDKKDQLQGGDTKDIESSCEQVNKTNKTVEVVEAGWAVKYNDLKRRLFDARDLLQRQLTTEKESSARLTEELNQRSKASSDLEEELRIISQERNALADQFAGERAARQELEGQLDQQAKELARLLQETTVLTDVQQRLDREIQDRIQAQDTADEQQKTIIRLAERLKLETDGKTEIELHLRNEREAHARTLRQLDSEKAQSEKLSKALLHGQNERFHAEQTLKERLIEHEGELAGKSLHTSGLPRRSSTDVI